MEEWRYGSTILDLGASDQLSHPGRFTPEEIAHGIHYIGG
jgi:hypothetical protein